MATPTRTRISAAASAISTAATIRPAKYPQDGSGVARQRRRMPSSLATTRLDCVGQVGHAHRAEHDEPGHPGREQVRGRSLADVLDPAELQREQRPGQDQAGHERPRRTQQQGQLIAELAADDRDQPRQADGVIHGSALLHW